MSVDGTTLHVDMRMNVEAFVAGIDLDGVEDTDETLGAASYDTLRALSADALRPEFETFAAQWLSGIGIVADGTPVVLDLRSLNIPPVGNIELPRTSQVVLSGALPDGVATVQVTWPKGAGGLVLRQQGVPEPFTGFLEGGETSIPIPLAGGAAPTGWETFATYIPVGFDHILPKGLDHILFVLGLFFLSLRMRTLIWQISAFTLAHTVTLALGALGHVSVPGQIVEPLIAASIVFVAVENLFTDGLNRWRPAVVFGFGLLHGLGFASVLEEFGLPSDQFIPALIGFNVGVEIGQLTVIALAFVLVGYWFGQKPWYRARIAIPASCVIAAVGAWWVIERVFL